MSILLLCVVLMTYTCEFILATTTVPLKPISCHLCRGPKFICERAHAPQICLRPEQQFCINDVENLDDGSRFVTRRCATKAECEKDWLLQSANRSECAHYHVDDLQAAHFNCSFCCKGYNCNSATVPPVLAFG